MFFFELPLDQLLHLAPLPLDLLRLLEFIFRRAHEVTQSALEAHESAHGKVNQLRKLEEAERTNAARETAPRGKSQVTPRGEEKEVHPSILRRRDRCSLKKRSKESWRKSRGD